MVPLYVCLLIYLVFYLILLKLNFLSKLLYQTVILKKKNVFMFEFKNKNTIGLMIF